MRTIRTIISLVLAAIVLLTVACQDLGVGEDADSYQKYFSTIHALSHSGRTSRETAEFIQDIDLDNAEDMKTVVPMDRYAYICMRVAEGYEIDVEEFALFFKGAEGTDAILTMDFFVATKPPSKLKTDEDQSVYIPENDPTTDENQSTYAPETEDAEGEGSEDPSQTESTDRDGETDEAAFETSAKKYFTATIHVDESWNSAHFVFENGAQTVKSGEYIIIRIENNLYSAEHKAAGYISFTFNYPMFRVVRVNGKNA